MAKEVQTTRPRSLLLPLTALAFSLFLWPAMLTFSPGDWPSPNQYPHNSPTLNACGLVGAWFAYELHHLVGQGAYPLLLFAALWSFLRLVRGRLGNVAERTFGLALLVACTAATTHLISDPTHAPLPTGQGGLVGYALGDLLHGQFDRLGTVIVLVSSFCVGLLFTTEGWVLKLPSTIGRATHAAGGVAAAAGTIKRLLPPLRAAAVAEGVTTAESDALLAPNSEAHPRAGKGKHRAEDAQRTLFDVDDEADGDPSTKHEARSNAQPTPAPAAEPTTKAAEPKSLPAKAVGPIVRFLTPQQVARAEPYPRQIEEWRLPSPNLLQEPTYGFSAQQEVVVREQARILERTLEDFRVDAQVVEIDTGPVITMFELKLGAGIKVSQIASLTNDVARALKAHAVRVVAPISGKNTVGIEVPNTQKERVRLRELLMLAGKKASEMRLPLFLGKDAGGSPLLADLAGMPHLLIAGTTGSGKSVCLNTIILSLLMTKRPDHVKMILIDPKMVELSQFKQVPHLMCPIVTDMARGEKILEWAVTKMEERYELLAEARVKNIAGYNALGADGLYARLKPQNADERARIPVHMPFIVIVIDELADLMMMSAREVEHHLARLAQKSRAVGIHIIVATQRPEVKVVTGLIKSNMPCRICFRVASRMDSRIVLDQNGGEVLMGQGDMLFLPPGQHKLTRAQGTYLDDGEVHAVLDDLASRAEPEFHPELIRIKGPGSEDDPDMRDPLFDDAVRIVLESKRGSVSLLQRRLTVGYSRASRLIDQMADAGIVGDFKGSQAREVLMTLDQWDNLQAQVAADLRSGYEADEVETMEAAERS
jgi:S-DNA-T family DNA segregation ATPase FtsK/SpoIIIE